MKLLILGGTRFLGHHLVTAALERDHEVTIFHRGEHQPAPSLNTEVILGDRNRDLETLRGRFWDAVIDTCGYLPASVAAAAELLSASVDRYVFISSISVYADKSVSDLDETAPLAVLSREQLERANEITLAGSPSAATYAEMYGGLKALCEQAAEKAMTNRTLVIRPGLIVGSRDYTDRFTYWVGRLARGGEILAPGRPERPVQLIDVRDLSEWVVKMIELQNIGTYNVTSLPNKLTMGMVLETCKAVSRSDANLTWVSEEFLLQQQISAWSEMPLWIPESYTPLKGFMLINSNKAVGFDLSFRPLKDTIEDVLVWEMNLDEPLQAGIDPAKEQSLLRRWHEGETTQRLA